MNRSHFEHVAVAVVLQVVIGLLAGNLLAGAAFGAAVFVGREHAQAEYRWIEQYGAGKRANLPWWGGFDPRVWEKDALLDWLAPAVAVACVALAARLG